MSANLTYLPLDNIGINGLNTQANPTALDPSWLIKSDNIAFKESGRITFRNGFIQKVASISAATPIESIGEYKTAAFDYEFFCGANNEIYKVDLSNASAAFTTKYSTGITANDWQFINFNNKLVALQSGHIPLTYNGTDWLPIGIDTSTTVNVGTFVIGTTYKIVTVGDTTQAEWETAGLGAGIPVAIDIEFVASTIGATATGTAGTTYARTGNAPASVTTFDPSCGTGYYGRIWAGGITENKDVVYYSDTLIETEWRRYGPDGIFGGGDDTSAGYIDLASVWGQDEIIAIEPFYGQLVIFGKHNIVIYANPIDPLNMTLVEVIRGIGCVSRDTVQQVADDLFFLSSTGLRSLARTTEKDNIPLTDLSSTVKDNLIRDIKSNTTTIKSAYVEEDGLYLLVFESLDIVYVFDMKHITPAETPRVTLWTFKKTAFNIKSLINSESEGFLVGQQSGSIAYYDEYSDKEITSVSGIPSVILYDSIIAYTGLFQTTWIDLGEGVTAALLKKLIAVIGGGSDTDVSVSWDRDFGINTTYAGTVKLNPPGDDYLYGIAKYSCNKDNTDNPGDLGFDYTSGDMCVYEDDGLAYDEYVVTDYVDSTGEVSTRWTHDEEVQGSGYYFCHPLSAAPTHCEVIESEYASTKGLKEYKVPLSKSAKHVQFTFSAETKGSSTILQDLTLLFKRGKIR